MYLHGIQVKIGGLAKLPQKLREAAWADEDRVHNPGPDEDVEGRQKSAKEYMALAIQVEANLAGIWRVFTEDKQALRAEPQDLLDLCLSLSNFMDIYPKDWNRVVNENTRRRMNASRAEREQERAALAVKPGEYEVGERVEVHAMGHWYTGTLVRYATKGGKVLVRYTSGAGVTRDKMVGSDLIRKRS